MVNLRGGEYDVRMIVMRLSTYSLSKLDDSYLVPREQRNFRGEFTARKVRQGFNILG